MEILSFKEALIHWTDAAVNQFLPLANALCHVFTGAIVFFLGSKFGGVR